MLGVTFIALSSGGNVLAFIDIPALVIIFVFALLFSMADTKSIKGAIMLLNCVDSSNLEWLPKATGTMHLTVFYAHMVKAMCLLFLGIYLKDKLRGCC